MDLGRRFKYYRKKADLTLKEAAELIGVKYYQLSNYETNRSEPSLTTLKKMSQAYLVSIDKLLDNKFDEDVAILSDSLAEEEELIDMEEMADKLIKMAEQMKKAK